MNYSETIGELIEKLNTVVRSSEFTDRLCKVHDHSKFHDLVAEFVYPLLPSEVYLSIWNLKLDGQSYREMSLASYTREFAAYKNSKHNDKGIFSDVVFKFNGNLHGGITIKQAYACLRKDQISKIISEYTEYAVSLKKQLAYNKKVLSELRSEFRTL